MVRALEEEQENYRARLFRFRGMYEDAGRHAKSMSADSGSALEGVDDDDRIAMRSQGSRSLNEQALERQQIGSVLNKNDHPPPPPPPVSRLTKDEAGPKDKQPSSGKSPLFLSKLNIPFYPNNIVYIVSVTHRSCF